MRPGRAALRAAAATAAAAALAIGPPPALAAKPPKGQTATYTPFDTLTATIMHADHTRGVLSVQAGLDVPDPRLHARAAADAPRLRDAYVRLLNIYAESLAPDSVPDVDQIGRLLQRATDDILGRPGARILLGSVLVN